MPDLFACPKCYSLYAITRRRQHPDAAPHCEVCNSKFPPQELGDWLTYKRAQAEETANEWLASPTNIPESSVIPPAQTFPAAPAIEVEQVEISVNAASSGPVMPTPVLSPTPEEIAITDQRLRPSGPNDARAEGDRLVQVLMSDFFSLSLHESEIPGGEPDAS